MIAGGLVANIAVMMRRALVFWMILMVPALPADAADALMAAGRIEFARTGGSCSGVLVTPGVVATAAHCVPDTDGGVGVTGIAFRTAPPAAPVRVAKAYAHPLYDPDAPRIDWRYRFDLGLLVLADPDYGADLGTVPVGDDAMPGETLFLVSWRKSDGAQPRQRACPVLSIGLEGLVTLGCDVKSGESGAPLFRKTDEGAIEVVAIISSRGALLDQPIAQASNLRLRLPPMLDLARRAGSP